MLEINFFQNAKFKKIEYLCLNYNEISDITALSNFKELKRLFLRGNKISDLKVFKKATFPNLKILKLEDNNLSEKDISKIHSELFHLPYLPRTKSPNFEKTQVSIKINKKNNYYSNKKTYYK